MVNFNIIQFLLLPFYLMNPVGSFTGSNVDDHREFQFNWAHLFQDVSDNAFQPGNKTYYVVSGSFIVQQNAVRRSKQLVNKGYSSTSIKIFPESEYYSVVVDSFKEELKAQQLRDKLISGKYECFIKELVH
ncbi:MAG: SPOR domain-containing protein [Saprospiraceae bacterium]|nr:SPOR domain-containing protein [Saprospiraceae bacterium]